MCVFANNVNRWMMKKKNEKTFEVHANNYSSDTKHIQKQKQKKTFFFFQYFKLTQIMYNTIISLDYIKQQNVY